MENSYAQALWNLLEKGMKPKEAVRALREALVRHGREALLARIGRAFTRIAAREEARRRVTMTVARERDADKALRDARSVLDQIGVEGKDVGVVVENSQIGGWRLEGRETLVDASYKNHLLDLYKGITTTQ